MGKKSNKILRPLRGKGGYGEPEDVRRLRKEVVKHQNSYDRNHEYKNSSY